MDIIDFVHYNHAVRELYFEALEKLPWKKLLNHEGQF